MPCRFLIILVALAWIVGAPLTAQKSRPLTPDGRPDLQGFWENDTVTPLERPAAFADRAFFSEQEAAEFQSEEQYNERYRRTRGNDELATSGELNGQWNTHGRIGRDRRTSLIVDPPDGRLPRRTPDAQARFDARQRWLKAHGADGPEDLPLSERCLLWGAGPPLIPVAYNNNLQIVQTRDAVMILHEMIHDARIVPLDGRPHLPPSVQQWTGDSRGHWDGDTLVVDTTNFTDKTAFQGSGTGLHVVERFTRTDPQTLRYEFTVDDSTSFARPWSGGLWMTKTDDRIYEYACHEANYSMMGILRGARAEEKDR